MRASMPVSVAPTMTASAVVKSANSLIQQQEDSHCDHHHHLRQAQKTQKVLKVRGPFLGATSATISL